ncbi:MAG: hypothetical protein MRJ92_01365 [Nitrospira sp.]|nr:hypothetical protein [Nitrospira sp.]
MKTGTTEQVARGRKLYQEHGCQNCHYTPAGTPKGSRRRNVSTSFIKLRERLKADWVYRFNLN